MTAWNTSTFYNLGSLDRPGVHYTYDWATIFRVPTVRRCFLNTKSRNRRRSLASRRVRKKVKTIIYPCQTDCARDVLSYLRACSRVKRIYTDHSRSVVRRGSRTGLSFRRATPGAPRNVKERGRKVRDSQIMLRLSGGGKPYRARRVTRAKRNARHPHMADNGDNVLFARRSAVVYDRLTTLRFAGPFFQTFIH